MARARATSERGEIGRAADALFASAEQDLADGMPFSAATDFVEAGQAYLLAGDKDKAAECAETAKRLAIGDDPENAALLYVRRAEALLKKIGRS